MKKLLSIVLAVMAVILVGFNPIKIREGTCYGIVVHNFPRAYNDCRIEIFEEHYQNRKDIKWEYWSNEELEKTLKEQYAQKRITVIGYDGDFYTEEELIIMMTK